MNHHLNLFKPYYQNNEQIDPVENNLTRALVIAMQNNALFFYRVIELIANNAKPYDNQFFKTLFSEFRDFRDIEFELQTNMRDIEDEAFPGGIIAVSLTADSVEMDSFRSLTFSSKKETNRITDIFLTVKSALFVIEVKKYANDCRQQLYDQIHFLKETGNEVRGASITWTDILLTLYSTNSIQKLTYDKNVFTEDMVVLLETHFPGIIPALPFSSFPYTFDQGSSEWEKMKRRLQKCVNGIEDISEYKIRHYPDRSPVALDWDWAKEVSFWFSDQKGEPCLNAFIWPANTKGQGWSVYHKPLGWTRKNSLKVAEYDFELKILYEVKFCHFNRFVSSFVFDESKLQPGMQLHNLENFENSGKYERVGNGEYTWPKLAEWLDGFFIDSYDWRKACGWQSNFEQSDRSYLTVSFGFQVRCIIPYALLQSIDLQDSDYIKISYLFRDIVNGYQSLLITQNEAAH